MECIEKNLVETIIYLTGLPKELIRNELESLAKKEGKNLSSMTMEDFRELVATFLQDVMLESMVQSQEMETQKNTGKLYRFPRKIPNC